MAPGQIRIGTSGWVYGDWPGRFYPETLPQRRWLEFYAQHFDTVEVNSTFYHLPREATIQGWRARTPEGFLFAVKGSRFITHHQRLQGVEEPLERLLSLLQGFGEKLGPVLFQFPPSFHADRERLEAFLRLWPSHLRLTLEFRHPTWFCEDIYGLLRDFNAALCISDGPRFPKAFVRTADFVYTRLHGAVRLYVSRYSEEELRWWAEQLLALTEGGGCDLFVYFDNDVNAHAVENARTLRELLRSL